MNIPERISELLRWREMSEVELCESIDMPRSTFRKHISKGGMNFTIYELERIASVLGVPTGDLLKDTPGQTLQLEIRSRLENDCGGSWLELFALPDGKSMNVPGLEQAVLASPTCAECGKKDMRFAKTYALFSRILSIKLKYTRYSDTLEGIIADLTAEAVTLMSELKASELWTGWRPPLTEVKPIVSDRFGKRPLMSWREDLRQHHSEKTEMIRRARSFV